MPRRYSYPENLLFVLHLNEETQRTICYDALTDDQRKGLEYALSALSEREQIVLRRHFVEGIGYKTIGLHYNLSESRTRNIIRDALCWLHKNPAWLYYITDGFEARTAYLRQQFQTEERIYRERCGITSPAHLYYQGLEALHLPAKLHNPLSRNGVKTVREVLIFLCSSAQIRKQNGVVSCHYVDSWGFKELPGFLKPENYLKNAEMAMEDDYGMIDGIINNGPRKTVAELEEQSKTGTPISLLELAQAVQREDEEKHRAQQPVRREKSGEKPSILAKLKTPSVADTKSVKSAPKRSAEREL